MKNPHHEKIKYTRSCLNGSVNANSLENIASPRVATLKFEEKPLPPEEKTPNHDPERKRR